jgi:hypothetical protein
MSFRLFPTCLALACVALGAVSPAMAQDSPEAALAAFRERQAQLAALGDSGSRTKLLSESIFSARFEPADGECRLDSDGDTLPDCAETHTGRYVSATDTGTDPNNRDSDGDGLSDGIEVMGTLDGLDLPALGVNPLRKDLLVEYDWFEDANDCGTHSHAPRAETLARLAAMYAAAPVANPDGSTGIHLVQDAGQGGALSGGNRIEGGANLPGAFDATHASLKSANFDPRRAGVFHYVVLAHRYNGTSNSSGYAEIVGDDALVTLQCYNTVDNQARTIAHELGHNLGLHHGGFEACNGKPNYNSLMNYRYQFAGLDAACSASGDGRSDGYSIGTRVAIDEAAVDEAQGVCGNPAIDWNANGSVESGIAIDINPQFAAECGAALTRQNDFDDWANITLLGLRDANGQLKTIKQETGCAGAPAPGKH